MASYANLDDKARLDVVAGELERFNKLIKGHRRFLQAIAEL